MGNFVTCNPSEALVKNGCSGTTIHAGQTTFKLWLLETVQVFSLRLRTIEVSSTLAATSQGVRVTVVAVAQIRVKSDASSIVVASENFLGETEENITASLQNTLEGHQRQIIAGLTVRELYTNRDAFAAEVKAHVVPALDALGFGLASYVVANVSDEDGYLDSLGVAEVARVVREASSGKAKNESAARKEVASSLADASTAEAVESNRAHVATNKSQQAVDASERDLDLKRSNFAREVSTAVAEAANASEIETAKQQQHILREKGRQKQVEETILLDVANQRVERAQKEKEGFSSAELLAQRHTSEAVEVSAKARATELRVVGEAEADVIALKGEAEADALGAKADAFRTFGDAAVLELTVSQMPAIAHSVLEPISNIKAVNFIVNT